MATKKKLKKKTIPKTNADHVALHYGFDLIDIKDSYHTGKGDELAEEEKVKLAVQNTKEELYPTNILGGLAPLLQKVAISLIAKKLLKKLD